MKRMSTKFLGLFLVMVMVSTMLPAALPVSAAVASIDEVKLTLAEPTVGGPVSPSITITGQNRFTVKEAHWIHGGTFETNPGVMVGTETTEFEAGRPYYAGITLTANDGYNFTSTTIVEILILNTQGLCLTLKDGFQKCKRKNIKQKINWHIKEQ